jgi:cytochrome P450
MSVAAAADLDDRLRALFASDPQAMADPYAVLSELRDVTGVHSLDAMTLISRHAEVRRASRDAERLSSATYTGSRASAALARMDERQRDAYRLVSEFESRYVSRSDGDQHGRLRRIMQRAFTPRRMAEMEVRVGAICDELLDDLARAERPDLVPFAWRLPLLVVGELLEVPRRDIDRIHEWSSTIGRNRRGVDPDALLPALDAIAEFREYVEALLAEHRGAEHRSGLLTALLGAGDEQRLSSDELTATFVILLFAGHETTTGLLTNGMVELLRHPQQWLALCADPGLAGPATEELLRFVSPVQWTWRVVARPYEVDGIVLPIGTTIGLLLAAANRDPEVFADPETLDLRRPDAGRHVAFGLGPHFCLGNALARLEAEVAFGRLAQRFPSLTLGSEPIRWRGNAMMRQVQALPVSLGPADGSADGHELERGERR